MNTPGVENNNMLQFELLAKDGNMSHFMTTRRGGVSEGEYCSFNLGEFAGDKLEHVTENRRRLASLTGVDIENLILPHQIHQDSILKIDSEFLSLSAGERRKASSGFDALVTDIPEICIGVTTADCVPLLVYDKAKKVLAAVHAGWRGTVAKIAPQTIGFMQKEYGCRAEDLLVGIGASISIEKFEVGDEVAQAFHDAGISLKNTSYRDKDTSKWHIDLQEVNREMLIEAGVAPHNTEIMRLCTQSRDDLFFSARRQGVQSGRMVTGGVLRRK